MPDTYTKTEIEEKISPHLWSTVNRWLERGDGIAVYQNVELGHPDCGHQQVASFGSSEAQFPGEPPIPMPDFPGQINWRYRLQGTYRGEPLG